MTEEVISTKVAYEVLEEWGFLDDEDMPRIADLLPEQIVAYLDHVEERPTEPLNVEELRYRLQWARKSREVEENRPIDWDQTLWARTTIPDGVVPTPISVPVGATVDDDLKIEGVVLPVAAVREDFCNTVGCLAGGIAMDHGEVLWVESKTPSADGKPLYEASYMVDGNSIESFAANYLGLTGGEMELLFSEENTIDDAERLAEAFCLRRGLRL